MVIILSRFERDRQNNKKFNSPRNGSITSLRYRCACGKELVIYGNTYANNGQNYCYINIVRRQRGFKLWCCPSVRLSPNSVHKNAIFSKTKQFRAMASIDDL